MEQIQLPLTDDDVAQKHRVVLRIVGPGQRGHFAIHDLGAHVFDGESWRGFGPAWQYPTFQEAFIALRRQALPAHIKTYPNGIEQFAWIDEGIQLNRNLAYWYYDIAAAMHKRSCSDTSIVGMLIDNGLDTEKAQGVLKNLQNVAAS